MLIENNNLAELLPRWLPSVVIEREGFQTVEFFDHSGAPWSAKSSRVVTLARP